MTTTEKYIKESKDLLKRYDVELEEKLNFLNEQIEGFSKQAYRFETEIDIAQEYIRVGEKKKEDQYIETGQNKIQECVGHLRSIVINIEVLKELREEVRKEMKKTTK